MFKIIIEQKAEDDIKKTLQIGIMSSLKWLQKILKEKYPTPSSIYNHQLQIIESL